jgi:hypothetical protein
MTPESTIDGSINRVSPREGETCTHTHTHSLSLSLALSLSPIPLPFRLGRGVFGGAPVAAAGAVQPIAAIRLIAVAYCSAYYLIAAPVATNYLSAGAYCSAYCLISAQIAAFRLIAAVRVLASHPSAPRNRSVHTPTPALLSVSIKAGIQR